MGKTTQRYSLNANQIHVLKLMFKFRFVTSSLLARYKGISRISSNKTLNILLDQQYIGKHYDKSYKIQGKGASYHLAPKALTDRNLDVFSAYLALRDSYPGTFHIFTKPELGDYDYLPSPAPDLYLNRIDKKDDQPDEYMLDIFADTQFFVLKKRLATILEHYESGEWESETETGYPAILLACPDSRMEQKLQVRVAKILDNSGIDDLQVLTTTKRPLLDTPNSNVAIWSDVLSPVKLIGL